MSTLGLPLLESGEEESSNDFEPRGQFSSSWYMAPHNVSRRHEQNFILGMLAFQSGGLCDTIGNGLLRDRTGWSWFFLGFLQTTGLVWMTRCDMDINLFLKHNKAFVVLFVFLSLSNSAASFKFSTYAWWIETLPFLYLLLYFNKVTKISKGYPMFSELFLLTLMLNISGTWGAFFFTRKGNARDLLVGSITILGALSMAYISYRNAPWRGKSANIQFIQVIYTYLFILGLSVGLWMGRNFKRGTRYPTLQWLFIPIGSYIHCTNVHCTNIHLLHSL
jgi:hypothetical protein